MSWTRLTRRRLLRRTGGLAAAGTVGATAGCASLLSSDDAALLPAKWVGAPGRPPARAQRRFSYQTPAHALEHEDHIADRRAETFETGPPAFGYTELAAADATAIVTYRDVTVVEIPFDEGAVAAELRARDFSEAGEHAGYTVWTADAGSTSGDAAFGLAGDRFVFGEDRGDADARSVVEDAIDVARDEADSYADESDAMATLMDRLGTHDLVFGRAQDPPTETDAADGRFAGNTALGWRWQINGETSRVAQVFVFEDADADDVDAVEAWVRTREEADSNWSDAEDPRVRRRGNAVVVEGTIPSGEFGLF